MAVEPGGYDVARYEPRRADEVVPEWQVRFGAGSNTASSTDDGLLIDTLTSFLQAVDEKGSLAYNAGFFNSSTGLNLDNLIGGLFGSKRGAARGSTGQVLVYGDAGTVLSPTGAPSEISNQVGNPYTLAGPVTLALSRYAVFIFAGTTGASSATTLTINAVQYGPSTPIEGTGLAIAQNMAAVLPFVDSQIVQQFPSFTDPAGNGVLVVELQNTFATTVLASASVASQSRGVFAEATSVELEDVTGEAFTLTIINTPEPGWLGAVNLETVTPGDDQDTDAEFRKTHLDTLGKGGTSSLIAMLSILRDIKRNPGVQYVQIYENDEGTTDPVSGRPSHSFEVVIDGGTDLTIVTLIWENKPTGIRTYGDFPGFLISDVRAAGLHRIRFRRAVREYVHVQATLVPGEGFPSTATSDIEASVSSQLIAFGSTLGIGRDVYTDEMIQNISVAGTSSISFLLGKTTDPLEASPALSPVTTLAMGEIDLSVWRDISITVVIAP